MRGRTITINVNNVNKLSAIHLCYAKAGDLLFVLDNHSVCTNKKALRKNNKKLKKYIKDKDITGELMMSKGCKQFAEDMELYYKSDSNIKRVAKIFWKTIKDEIFISIPSASQLQQIDQDTKDRKEIWLKKQKENKQKELSPVPITKPKPKSRRNDKEEADASSSSDAPILGENAAAGFRKLIGVLLLYIP